MKCSARIFAELVNELSVLCCLLKSVSEFSNLFLLNFCVLEVLKLSAKMFYQSSHYDSNPIPSFIKGWKGMPVTFPFLKSHRRKYG